MKKNIYIYIYFYLKCIVYDKLLEPRQSFRRTLYIRVYSLYLDIHIRQCHPNSGPISRDPELFGVTTPPSEGT